MNNISTAVIKNLLSGMLPAFMMVMMSCSKTSVAQVSQTDEIIFSTGSFDAEVNTKAVAVTELDAFNVLAVTGTLGSSESTVFNAAFTKSGSNYVGGKYWPSSDANYKFYAANAGITPAAGGPSIVATNDTDIVCAVLAAPTYREGNLLSFSHIFARLTTVTPAAPTGFTVSNLSIRITPKTRGTYALFQGYGKTDGTGWSAVYEGVEQAVATAVGDNSNDIYLIPGEYSLTANYTLTSGAYIDNYTKTATVSLVAGKTNTITTTLPHDAKEISFTVTISPWEDYEVEAEWQEDETE